MSAKSWRARECEALAYIGLAAYAWHATLFLPNVHSAMSFRMRSDFTDKWIVDIVSVWNINLAAMLAVLLTIMACCCVLSDSTMPMNRSMRGILVGGLLFIVNFYSAGRDIIGASSLWLAMICYSALTSASQKLNAPMRKTTDWSMFLYATVAISYVGAVLFVQMFPLFDYARTRHLVWAQFDVVFCLITFGFAQHIVWALELARAPLFDSNADSGNRRFTTLLSFILVTRMFL